MDPGAPDYSDVVDRAVVNQRFAHRPPSPAQAARLQSLQEGARLLAHHVLRSCPPSGERDAALLALDAVLSYAELAIKRHE